MSKWSSNAASCGGDGSRFLRGGEGARFSRKDKMVPFFLPFLFLAWGTAFADFAGAISTGISSSVAGGEERADSVSEEDMVIAVAVVW